MDKKEIFGTRALIEAIKAGKQIEKVYLIKSDQNKLLKELYSLIKEHKISYSYVPEERFNKFSDKNHQGVYARISPIRTYEIEDVVEKIDTSENPIILILDQINDVRNFGAIARTAECTGVKGIIILKKGSASINSDAIKTSAGGLYKIPIIKVDHIKDAIYYLQGTGYQIISASEKTTKLVYEVDFKQPTAIIMGSEGKGIHKSTLKLSNHVVKLPMLGEISSLNVSVACGAVLYEAVRQQQN